MTEPVTIYSSETCGPCLSLKKFLDHKGVPYKIFDIKHKTHADKVLKLTGSLVVPVTVIEGTPVSGLNYRRISELLNV